MRRNVYSSPGKRSWSGDGKDESIDDEKPELKLTLVDLESDTSWKLEAEAGSIALLVRRPLGTDPCVALLNI